MVQVIHQILVGRHFQFHQIIYNCLRLSTQSPSLSVLLHRTPRQLSSVHVFVL